MSEGEVTYEQVADALTAAEHMEQEQDFYGRFGMRDAIKDAYARADELEKRYNETHTEPFR